MSGEEVKMKQKRYLGFRARLAWRLGLRKPRQRPPGLPGVEVITDFN